MDVHHLVLQIISLLLFLIKVSSLKYSCPDSCGSNDSNLHISYPFGIGEGCYYDKRFKVTCNDLNPFLASSMLQVLRFYPASSSDLRVAVPVIMNSNNSVSAAKEVDLSADKAFPVSIYENWFTATGCDNYDTIGQTKKLVKTDECISMCSCDPTQKGGCYDFICALPLDHKLDMGNMSVPQGCKSAFVVDRDLLEGSTNLTSCSLLKEKSRIPARLQWGENMGECLELYSSHNTVFCYRGLREEYCSIKLNPSHVCLCRSGSLSSNRGCRGDLVCIPSSKNSCSSCPDGYHLSPGEMPQICRPENYDEKFDDIFETSRVTLFIIIGCCAGLGTLFLFVGVLWLYKLIKRRKAIKLKQKFFKRNGGLLLKQHLSSNVGKIEKTRLFTSEELEKATENYNTNRILGQGGQGTVYKGMMSEGRIVAIKRSKILDESNLDDFINEVVILSQINHRNVVQLLGCCLETEVPLLVYEFIPNGTLFQYIHDENEEFPITWELCLRIATEVAEALSYLHSAASMPIYHRDIKSGNILLDDKYRAKVSDFGTSRSTTIDQTHLTTQVHGTFGYLDPEYFRSSQFSDKSDVYSFGVVLAELLTRQMPIRSIEFEDRSLVDYFLCAMKENRLFEILDPRVLKEGKEKEILIVANLTRRCLNLKGKKRPTMKEVATELAGIRKSNGASIMQQNCEEIDDISADDISDHFDTDSSSIETASW